MAKKPHKRTDRVANLVQQEVSRALITASHDERLARITITNCKLSPDLRIARLYYALLDESDGFSVDDAEELLRSVKGHLRYQLGQNINTKYTPDLVFHYDNVLQKARRIEDVLREIDIPDDEHPDPLEVEVGVWPKPLGGEHSALADSLQQAAELIRNNDSFVVCAHFGPDGDAIGSTLAVTQLLREMGKQVTPFNRDQPPTMFEFLPNVADIVNEPADLPAHDVLIVLDCCELSRVHPKLTVDRNDTKTLCIDHHQAESANFADIFVHDVTASSVGELIYRLIVRLDVKLSRSVGECLYTSLITDTGCFRYSNTSSVALRAASEIVRAGVNAWDVSSQIYENHPEARVHALADVLKTLELSPCGRLAFITVEQDMLRRTEASPGMLDGFINFARGIRGVEVAVQLREINRKHFKLSLRSRGRADVGAFATRFGGGGHHNAAGCLMNGSQREIKEQLNHGLLDLMGDEPRDS